MIEAAAKAVLIPCFLRFTAFSVAFRFWKLFLLSVILFSSSSILPFKAEISFSMPSAFSLPPLSSTVSMPTVSLCTSAVLSFNFSAAASSFARHILTFPTYISSITPPSERQNSSFALSSSSLAASISFSLAAFRISCSLLIIFLSSAAFAACFSVFSVNSAAYSV